MLSMVLLVLLLCFEPAKASLLEPAKAALLLALLEPAKARPPLPWWRVRVWESRYWLCSPSGYMRELEEDEEDELEDIFDANKAAGKCVWQQSSECLAGNCWAVSWNEPDYRWHDYVVPAEAGTADYYQHWEDWSDWTPSQPAQGYDYSSSSQPPQRYGYHSSRSSQPGQGGQPRGRSQSRPRASPVEGWKVQLQAPFKEATQRACKGSPKADAYQHM